MIKGRVEFDHSVACSAPSRKFHGLAVLGAGPSYKAPFSLPKQRAKASSLRQTGIPKNSESSSFNSSCYALKTS